MVAASVAIARSFLSHVLARRGPVRDSPEARSEWVGCVVTRRSASESLRSTLLGDVEAAEVRLGARALRRPRLPLRLRDFCLIWLASAPPALVNWLASSAPGERIWPIRMLNCSCAAGPLADLAFTCSAVSLPPSITPPRGGEGGELLVVGQRTQFPWPARRCPRRPTPCASVPSEPSNAGGQRRALGRPPGQAVLDHHQVDVLAAQLLAKLAVARLAVQPDDVDQQQRPRTPCKLALQIVGHQVFDVLAHGLGCRRRSSRSLGSGVMQQHASFLRACTRSGLNHSCISSIRMFDRASYCFYAATLMPGLIVALIADALDVLALHRVRLHGLDVVDEGLDVLGQLWRVEAQLADHGVHDCRRRRCGTRPCRPCTRGPSWRFPASPCRRAARASGRAGPARVPAGRRCPSCPARRCRRRTRSSRP